MTYLEILVISVILALDATAVSVSCGLKLQRVIMAKTLKISLAFGIFQTGMTLIGYWLGTFARPLADGIAGWLAGAVFLALAVKTFHEAYSQKDQELTPCQCNRFRCLFSLAVATSIDALAIGAVLALSRVEILFPSFSIGVVAFAMSFAGLLFGQKTAAFTGRWSAWIAGLVFVALSVKSVWGD